MKTKFTEGDLVSIVGTSDYKRESIDAVILGFHVHATTKEIFYRVGYGDGYGEVLARTDLAVLGAWCDGWKLTERQPQKQEIDPTLAVRRMLNQIPSYP